MTEGALAAFPGRNGELVIGLAPAVVGAPRTAVLAFRAHSSARTVYRCPFASPSVCPPVDSLRVSPAGDRIVLTQDGALRVGTLSGGTPVVPPGLADRALSVSGPVWSGDGRTLFFEGTRALSPAGVGGGEPVFQTDLYRMGTNQAPERLTEFLTSPIDRSVRGLIAYGGPCFLLPPAYAYLPASRRCTPPRRGALSSKLSFSPGGGRIAFGFVTAAGRSGIAVGGLRTVARVVLRGAGAPAWSPDGRALAFLRSPGRLDGQLGRTVWISRVDGRAARRVFTAPRGTYITALDWGPARRRARTAAQDRIVPGGRPPAHSPGVRPGTDLESRALTHPSADRRVGSIRRDLVALGHRQRSDARDTV